METLENKPKSDNKLKEAFEKQGFELINVRFIDDETSFYITRKKEKN